MHQRACAVKRERFGERGTYAARACSRRECVTGGGTEAGDSPMPAAANNSTVKVAHRLLEEYVREIVHEADQGKSPVGLEAGVQAVGICHEFATKSDLGGRRTEVAAPGLGCGQRECPIARRPQEHEAARGGSCNRSRFAVCRQQGRRMREGEQTDGHRCPQELSPICAHGCAPAGCFRRAARSSQPISAASSAWLIATGVKAIIAPSPWRTTNRIRSGG